MAIEALKSTSVTAADNIASGAGTSPASKKLMGGILKESVATFEIAVKDVDSTYRICRIPAYARISEIFFKCDAAINSACAIDIGIYRTVPDGGAVVDRDCYATAIDLAGAGLVDQVQANVKWEVLDFGAKMEQSVWEDAGVSANPGPIEYDLVATTSTALNTTGGSLAFMVRYVDGN